MKAARATAKVGAATAREAAKTSVSAIKAAIAAAQELIASLAAGGWAVVAVVLVLCMVGLLIASPFGLFFSGAEGNGSGVPQAVAQINSEFTARIEQIKEETPHDVLDLDNDAVAAVLDNWRNVLAVYAVRASTDGGSPSGLDGLTAENLALLREVFWDMNQISSFTETLCFLPPPAGGWKSCPRRWSCSARAVRIWSSIWRRTPATPLCSAPR